MKKMHLAALLALTLLASSALPLLAQDDIIINFAGNGLETGGFDWSNAGDELNLISTVTNMVGPTHLGFPYFPADYEYTLVVTGLVSNGEIDHGIYSEITYNLGTFEIYRDASFNHDWDEFPVIGTPPSTFVDGELWISGDFYQFGMTVFRDLDIANYEGSMFMNGDGIAAPWFDPDHGYIFGGTMFGIYGGNTPPGYDFTVDGEYFGMSVPTQETTISNIKALY